MASEARERERGYTERERGGRDSTNDVVLTSRKFIWLMDTTRGTVKAPCGPKKVTVQGTELPMVLKDGKLVEVDEPLQAVQDFVRVDEGMYVVLTNPSEEGVLPAPEQDNQNPVKLRYGRKVNLPGPRTFPLWPEQSVEIIEGHQLQLNQYVLVRVINDEEARQNWSKAVVKPQVVTEAAKEGEAAPQQAPAQPTRTAQPPAVLSVGQLLIIKGTEVSFYIPPTGLEVVKDPSTGRYVRDAETLEQLEYCVLRDQSGSKRYPKGPQVVFPEPSETFVTEGQRKFKAIELTPISGIHVKVIQAYDEGGQHFNVGAELFITGKTDPIYYPRAEHATVDYETVDENGQKIKRNKYFATCIPKGEGRYVLDRIKGEVRTVMGADMFMPDPRAEVFVQRVLPERWARLWFPNSPKIGNSTKAIEYNKMLAEQAGKKAAIGGGIEAGFLASLDEGALNEIAEAEAPLRRTMFRGAESRLVGDSLTRSGTYTPPRSVTLDTEYQRAVLINVELGSAVLVIDREGNRRVVVGPEAVTLKFDEELGVMALSTGKPKSTDKLLETVYLQVLDNRVSDEIFVVTKDMVTVKIKVSYRVSFKESHKEKWFNSTNYVKLICDHERSKLRNMAKHYKIQEFFDTYIDLVRDCVLGKSPEPAQPGGERPPRKGSFYDENGAYIYDVEVLGLVFEDAGVGKMLADTQREAVNDTLRLADEERMLAFARRQEEIKQQIEGVKTDTELKKLELARKQTEAKIANQIAEFKADIEKAAIELKSRQADEMVEDASHAAALAREKATKEQLLTLKAQELEQTLKQWTDETRQLVERAKAIEPNLVAALQTFGDKALIRSMSETMALPALFGGKSIVDVLSQLLKGTNMDGLVAGLAGGLAARSTAPVLNTSRQ